MPEVAIVVSEQQDLSRRELAGTLAHELGRQGIPAALRLGRFPPARADQVTVLIDPLGYAAAEGEDGLPDEAVLRRTVFVCPDRAPTGGDESPEIALLARAGAVFGLDRRDVAVLHRAGIPARLMRPGYSDALDHYDASAERPIDIIVLGERTPRRAELLRRAAPVLARQNCLISLSEPGVHPQPGPGCPGEDRWPLLARSKVLINLHGDDDPRLEWSAVLDAIHAGAVVVSEHATGLAPLEPGTHLLVASADALPYVAERLLADPARLAQLRTQAYERLSTWIPYALPVSILRAAIVELVGEALPGASVAPPAAVAPAGTAPAGAAPAVTAPAVGSATATDPITPSPTPTPTPAPATTPGSPAGPAEQASALADSPAWVSLPAPRVTAVCVIDDALAALTATTLDSVAAERLRELELVVVHPAGGAAAVAATAWCEAHPNRAWRRIALTGSPSHSLARRAGALVARAPFVLLIQAGQTLYPRALDVLAGTLDGIPGAQLAYPILTGAGDSDRPLLNTAGDAIQAPLLVRADTLRGAPDAGDGALAARAAEVALVPQILGSREV